MAHEPVDSQQGLQTKSPPNLELGSPADTLDETVEHIDIPEDQWRRYEEFGIEHPQLRRFFDKWGFGFYIRYQRFMGR